MTTRRSSQLWKINVGTGFNAPPMSFEAGGKQYVAILSGISTITKTKHVLTPGAARDAQPDHAVRVRAVIVFPSPASERAAVSGLAIRASVAAMPRDRAPDRSPTSGRPALRRASCAMQQSKRLMN